LRRAGIVNARKQGLWGYYSVANHPAPLNLVLSSVSHCLGHVEAVRKDRKRLEAKTGCGCSLPDAAWTAAGCGAVNDRAMPPSAG